MTKGLKSTIKSILSPLSGYTLSNTLYQKIYLFSLYGMNYGNSGHFSSSGEKEVLTKIHKFYKRKPVLMFDVGANVGNYSFAAKKIFGKEIIIHCFEPSPDTFKKLNTTLDSLPGITLNNFGLSNINQQAHLYQTDVDSGMASIFKRDVYETHQISKIEQINLKKLDDYCVEKGITNISLLKMDIEGAELLCLQGAEKMINNGGIEMIQFEFGGCNIDSRTYFRDFWNHLNEKYFFYRIMKNGLIKIPVYSELNEIFTTSNFFLVKKEIAAQLQLA